MTVKLYTRYHIAPTQKQLLKPLQPILIKAPPLKSRSNEHPVTVKYDEFGARHSGNSRNRKTHRNFRPTDCNSSKFS